MLQVLKEESPGDVDKAAEMGWGREGRSRKGWPSEASQRTSRDLCLRASKIGCGDWSL